MKSILFLILSLIIVVAQNDLVIFTSGQERFKVILNGVPQNVEFQSNVRITRVTQPKVQARIKFENERIQDVVQPIFFMWNSEQKRNWEFIYQLKKTKSGKWKLFLYSADPMNGIVEPQVPEGQISVPYHDDNEWIYHPPANPSSPSPQQQTVTTSTVVSTGNQGSGGAGIQIIVPGSQGSVTFQTSGQTSQTITTSTTITTHSNSAHSNNPHQACLVNASRFENIKAQIKSKNFENSKLEIAKQIARSNCLKSEQIREIMRLFGFENSRLEFAKYAYKFTLDKQNYFLVNDAFEFETSIDELNKHIQNSH
ncbi:MAG: DUF4476 domain-containing protein [Bacteroidia bacterium]|nr:DUF4476 domain-containing protein [Bacteroidia bacterium]